MWNLFARRRPSRRPVSPHFRSVRLQLEQLESRVTPSASFSDLYTPMMVAGDETGTPADSPSNRVDPNTTTSYFSGVGSVQVVSRRGTYLGTGSVLTDSDTNSLYVLTAGHVVDINDDGKFDKRDGVLSVTFYLNYGGDQTYSYTISGAALYSSVAVNPNYTGFNHPSVSDDLSVLRFSGSAPSGLETYSIYSGDITHHVITMVGYGRSGNGDVGYTTNASWSVKHVGQNVVDAYYGQDDPAQPAANEVFRFDFDGPNSSTNYFGNNGSVNSGLTLGNNVETTLGGGDSGGPSFVWDNGAPTIAGVNTFTQGSNAPLFGSLGGGIVVGAYVNWLQSVVPGLGVTSGTLGSAPVGVSGTGTQTSQLMDEGSKSETAPKASAPVTVAPAAQSPSANAAQTTNLTLWVNSVATPTVGANGNSTTNSGQPMRVVVENQAQVNWSISHEMKSGMTVLAQAPLEADGNSTTPRGNAPGNPQPEKPEPLPDPNLWANMAAATPIQNQTEVAAPVASSESAECAAAEVGDFSWDSSKTLGLMFALALLLTGGCYQVGSRRRQAEEGLAEAAA